MAIFEMIIELIGVSWIIYGQSLFYSGQNTCNWEKRHSSAYIMMFLMLTFGMILIFKWIIKFLECSCLIKKRLFMSLPFVNRQNRSNRQGNVLRDPLLHHLYAPMQPEIHIISNALELRRLASAF